MTAKLWRFCEYFLERPDWRIYPNQEWFKAQICRNCDSLAENRNDSTSTCINMH